MKEKDIFEYGKIISKKIQMELVYLLYKEGSFTPMSKIKLNIKATPEQLQKEIDNLKEINVLEAQESPAYGNYNSLKELNSINSYRLTQKGGQYGAQINHFLNTPENPIKQLQRTDRILDFLRALKKLNNSLLNPHIFKGEDLLLDKESVLELVFGSNEQVSIYHSIYNHVLSLKTMVNDIEIKMVRLKSSASTTAIQASQEEAISRLVTYANDVTEFLTFYKEELENEVDRLKTITENEIKAFDYTYNKLFKTNQTGEIREFLSSELPKLIKSLNNNGIFQKLIEQLLNIVKDLRNTQKKLRVLDSSVKNKNALIEAAKELFLLDSDEEAIRYVKSFYQEQKISHINGRQLPTETNPSYVGINNDIIHIKLSQRQQATTKQAEPLNIKESQQLKENAEKQHQKEIEKVKAQYESVMKNGFIKGGFYEKEMYQRIVDLINKKQFDDEHQVYLTYDDHINCNFIIHEQDSEEDTLFTCQDTEFKITKKNVFLELIK